MTAFSAQDAIDSLTLHAKYLEPGHYAQLRSLVERYGGGPPADTKGLQPGSFDLLEEVTQQMAMVRALRESILGKAGQDGKGGQADPRELKSLIASSTSLFASLTKLHGEIINQDRVRKLEKATLAAVATLPEDGQALFFDALESALEKVD